MKYDIKDLRDSVIVLGAVGVSFLLGRLTGKEHVEYKLETMRREKESSAKNYLR